MRGYGQYCPIARGAEIFATRWTPIIIRNLVLGCQTFGEIQAGAPGIPRSVLTQRLRQLELYSLVERLPNPHGRGFVYQLTAAGEELRDVCFALGTWGARWLEVAREDLDAGVVLWSMCRLMEQDPERLPEERVVIRFKLNDVPKKRYWVVLRRPEAEVCMKPPGFEEDLIMTTDSEWLAKWHMGSLPLGQAMRQRLITIEGPRELVRAFSGWGGLSPFKDEQPVH